MKHQETSINNPAPKPTTSERGQNPAAEVDTMPAQGGEGGSQQSGQQGAQGSQGKQGTDKANPTANEIMNEQVSPQDEQGNRDQSDKPHIGG